MAHGAGLAGSWMGFQTVKFCTLLFSLKLVLNGESGHQRPQRYHEIAEVVVRSVVVVMINVLAIVLVV